MGDRKLVGNIWVNDLICAHYLADAKAALTAHQKNVRVIEKIKLDSVGLFPGGELGIAGRIVDYKHQTKHMEKPNTIMNNNEFAAIQNSKLFAECVENAKTLNASIAILKRYNVDTSVLEKISQRLTKRCDMLKHFLHIPVTCPKCDGTGEGCFSCCAGMTPAWSAAGVRINKTDIP